MSILGLGALTCILFYSILQLQCKDSYRCLFWLVVFVCLVWKLLVSAKAHYNSNTTPLKQYRKLITVKPNTFVTISFPCLHRHRHFELFKFGNGIASGLMAVGTGLGGVTCTIYACNFLWLWFKPSLSESLLSVNALTMSRKSFREHWVVLLFICFRFLQSVCSHVMSTVTFSLPHSFHPS